MHIDDLTFEDNLDEFGKVFLVSLKRDPRSLFALKMLDKEQIVR